MARYSSAMQAFSGGEVAESFFGRVSDGKYQTGLARCRNFLTAPHGPAYNRPGTRFVRAVKTPAKRTRLIPFVYSVDQNMVLEFGDGYIRFLTNGATLLRGTPANWSSLASYSIGGLVTQSGDVYYAIAPSLNQLPPNPTYWYMLPSTAYEIPSPYLEADLFKLRFEQSADVLTITRKGYAPRELRRLGATQWVLSPITFASSQVPPTGVAVAATVTTPGGTTESWPYRVTSVAEDGLDESLVSSTVTASPNNLAGVGNYNTITWPAAPGANRYNVYKKDNGLFGFIGQTKDLTFKDDNITADLSVTPPEAINPFNSTDDYPEAVTYYEQRRFFAGTNNRPQNFWGTRSGTESNLTYSIPTRADDSLSYKLAARDNNAIRHIVPMQDLIMLTSSAEMRAFSSGGALQPGDIAVKPQSYIGANDTRPIVVNNNLLFVAARGGHYREMAFSNDAGGYMTGDLSLRAPHLFDGYDIVDQAYAKAPEPLIWMVSSNGKLLSLSYVPEQQVVGWHWHDTLNGSFESVCVVPEGSEDTVYVVVNRTLGGVQTRTIERFATRQFTALEDAYFVDCGLTYDGAPATVLTGLDHLNGETVSILADGYVMAPRVVSGGSITLDRAASVVHVGLQITSQLQTLPLAFDTEAFGQTRTKNPNRVFLRLLKSLGGAVGPTFSKLREPKFRTTEPYGTGPALFSGKIEIAIDPLWGDDAQICLQQTDPLPFMLVAMQQSTSIGG